MTVIIDTSSLLSLVRYYLPFDKQSTLSDFIKHKIETNELIVIDAVYEECQHIARGLISQTLPYFGQIKGIKTDNITFPTLAKLLRQVDNQFAIGGMKNRLTDTEYENQKEAFLKSADMRMIIYCLQLQQEMSSASSLFSNDEDNKIVIVTEETPRNNDNKLFHKIPKICEILNIQTMTLPKLLEEYGVDMQFSLPL